MSNSFPQAKSSVTAVPRANTVTVTTASVNMVTAPKANTENATNPEGTVLLSLLLLEHLIVVINVWCLCLVQRD